MGFTFFLWLRGGLCPASSSFFFQCCFSRTIVPAPTSACSFPFRRCGLLSTKTSRVAMSVSIGNLRSGDTQSGRAEVPARVGRSRLHHLLQLAQGRR